MKTTLWWAWWHSAYGLTVYGTVPKTGAFMIKKERAGVQLTMRMMEGAANDANLPNG